MWSLKDGLTVTWLGLTLVWLLFIILWTLRGRMGGALVLRAGPPEETSWPTIICPALLVGSAAFTAASNWRDHGTLAPHQSSQVIAYMVWAAHLRLVMGRRELRERGILINGGFYRWGRLNSWVWQDAAPGFSDQVIVYFDHRSFWSRGITFRVPEGRGEMVRQMLEQHLGPSKP